MELIKMERSKDCFEVCGICNEDFPKYQIPHLKKHGIQDWGEYIGEILDDNKYLLDEEKYPRLFCGFCREMLPDIQKINYLSSEKLDVPIYGSRSVCENPDCIASKINPRAKVTKEKMIMFYGHNIGTKKWNEYCYKQAHTNSFEYKKKVHGMTREEFDEYNQSRSVTLENMIKRHGELKGRLLWFEYLHKQSYTNSLEYFQEKHGKEKGKEIYLRCIKSRSPSYENYLEAFGDEHIAIEKLKEFFSNRVCEANTGKIANEFFKSLGLENDVDSFPINGKEYPIFDKELEKVFLFDFRISNKLIEFDEVKTHKNSRVKLVDLRKTQLAEQEGFELLRISDEEYLTNKEGTIKKALDFIWS